MKKRNSDRFSLALGALFLPFFVNGLGLIASHYYGPAFFDVFFTSALCMGGSSMWKLFLSTELGTRMYATIIYLAITCILLLAFNHAFTATFYGR